MAKYACLLGDHDYGYPGQHVLQHTAAEVGILHLGSACAWVFRFPDSDDLCEFLRIGMDLGKEERSMKTDDMRRVDGSKESNFERGLDGI